ncbi:MAG: hypothetical protein M3203_12165, partial [Actinomycetota bacterium]|nr:hypothetical protein [Actinomycetota bacterium]
PDVVLELVVDPRRMLVAPPLDHSASIPGEGQAARASRREGPVRRPVVQLGDALFFEGSPAAPGLTSLG